MQRNTAVEFWWQYLLINSKFENNEENEKVTLRLNFRIINVNSSPITRQKAS
jgi:hypothetical protein